MKRILLISSLVIFAPLFYTGCDKAPDEVPSHTKDENTQRTPNSSEDLLIRPGIGVGPIKFGMTVRQMKDILGPPDVEATGISWMYKSLGIEIIAKDKQTISAISLGNPNNMPSPVIKALEKTCKFKTARGIGMGSADYEVIDLFGPPTTRTETRLAYKDKKIFFRLTDKKVIGIWLQK